MDKKRQTDRNKNRKTYRKMERQDTEIQIEKHIKRWKGKRHKYRQENILKDGKTRYRETDRKTYQKMEKQDTKRQTDRKTY